MEKNHIVQGTISETQNHSSKAGWMGRLRLLPQMAETNTLLLVDLAKKHSLHHKGTSFEKIQDLHSDEVSCLDLIVRWGGARRLSGFPPVQPVYADFYIIDEYWPDFEPQHFEQVLT